MFSLKAIVAGLAISGLVFASSAASYAADSTTTTVKSHHRLKAHAGRAPNRRSVRLGTPVKGHKVTGKRHAAKAGHRGHGKLGAHRGAKAGQAKGSKSGMDSHVGKQHGRQVQTHHLTNGGSRLLA